jgi:hypothetical protein
VNSLLDAWIDHDLNACRGVLEMIEREGYSATQLLTQLLAALGDCSAGAVDKARMGMGLAKCEARLVDGGDESVQLLALVVG